MTGTGPLIPPTNSTKDTGAVASFVGQTCLFRLRKLQNKDGGWGFNGGESRIEPTAWAALALQEFNLSPAVDGDVERALRFLEGTQLANGSWVAAPGQTEGCWVTSLACLALLGHGRYATSLHNGLQWLGNDRPRDASFLWRLARTVVDRRRISAQSAAFSGWSWTPKTASWVEPTCYALIAQRAQTALPKARRRRELAEDMLYDRMCPQGGWNCGNPMVYGVAGQPQVGPTVWALIALREHSEHPKNRQSLDWLESNCQTVRTPESLALTHIALSVYGRRNGKLMERLSHLQESAAFPWSVQALSWAALACSETARWLNVVPDPAP